MSSYLATKAALMDALGTMTAVLLIAVHPVI